jgi:hypothetical protein
VFQKLYESRNIELLDCLVGLGNHLKEPGTAIRERVGGREGTLLVPVTYCKKRAFSSCENPRRTAQKYEITGSVGLYPWYSV